MFAVETMLFCVLVLQTCCCLFRRAGSMDASKSKARHSERCTVLSQWRMLQLYWQGPKNESGGVGRSVWNAGTGNADANHPTRKPPPDQGHATLLQRQRMQSTPSIGRTGTSQRTRSLDGDGGESTSKARIEHQRDPPERLHALVPDPKRFALDSASDASRVQHGIEGMQCCSESFCSSDAEV